MSATHLKSWVSFFFFCSFFFTDYWLLQYTTGSRHVTDMSQVHGKFFYIYLQLYLLQCKHGLEAHLESDNRIDGMDREGKGEGKREETKEMGTTGNRGLEMHLRLEPSVCFFFISLFISTYTYLQTTTATENGHHVTHHPLTTH